MKHMFVFLLAVLLATAATGYYLLGEFNAVVGISMGISAYAFAQIMICNLMMTGHGVSGVKHFIGMPLKLFFFYVMLLVPTTFLWLPYEPDLLPITNANFRVAGLGMFYGWITALLEWYWYSHHSTFYCIEILERRNLKMRGFSQETIDATMREMRFRGMFRPEPPKPENKPK